MDSTTQSVHDPLDSTVSAPHFLSIPQELFDRIVELTLGRGNTIFLLRKDNDYDDRLAECAYNSYRGCLRPARTCRRLYEATNRQVYAKSEFKFKVAPKEPSDPTAFEVFLNQIGPGNAGLITSVCFDGMAPNEELGVGLSRIPALRKLYIRIRRGSDDAQLVFSDHLRRLRSSDVPSLRHLSVDVERQQNSSYDLWLGWTDIETAVQIARDTLAVEGSEAEITLSETRFYCRTNRPMEKTTRKYISAGIYEQVDIA